MTRAIIPKLQTAVPRYNARPGLPPNFPSTRMTDERLIHIEEKLTLQEDLIDELNKTVYQQQQKIERLEDFCRELAGRIRGLSEAANPGMPANERPPHY
jgi:SlyX protein